jgi:hypothetical protein
MNKSSVVEDQVERIQLGKGRGRNIHHWWGRNRNTSNVGGTKKKKGGGGVSLLQHKMLIRRSLRHLTIFVRGGLFECVTDGQDFGGGHIEIDNVLEDALIVLGCKVGQPPFAVVSVDLRFLRKPQKKNRIG